MAEKSAGASVGGGKVLSPELLKAVEQGRVVFFGEFRRGHVAPLVSRGGKVFQQSKILIETELGGISVVDFLPDEVKPADWRPPFNRGEMVFGVVRKAEESSGSMVVSAKLYPA